jgi:hypothetical protein
MYLTTFEQAADTLRKRSIEMPLAYDIVSGNEENIFSIHPKTGQIKILSENKMNRGKKSSYSIGVSSTDLGGLTTVTEVDITVLESNDPPKIFGANFYVTENKRGVPVGIPLHANDTDIAAGRQQSLSFSIVGGDPNRCFSINSATGQLSTTGTANLDFETQQLYDLTIQVSDDGPGHLTGSTSVIIQILDENERPSFAKTTRYAVENTPVNFIGNGQFIGGKGAENERGSYDGKSKSGKLLRCGNGASSCGTRKIKRVATIEGLREQFSGYILAFEAPDYNNVHENGPREGEYRVYPRTGAPLNQAGVYKCCLWGKVSRSFDGVEQLMHIKFYDKNNFLLGKAVGGFPSRRDRWEQVCIDFDSGKAMVSNFVFSAGYPMMNTAGSVYVYGLSVHLGTSIKEPIRGFDIDANDKLTYKLLSTGIPFDIDSTGVIQIVGSLNYESKPVYILDIEVVDSAGLRDYGQVEVQIVDANDPPKTTYSKRSVREDAARNFGIGLPLQVDDEDIGETFTFSITSGNNPSSTGFDGSNHVLEWLLLGPFENPLCGVTQDSFINNLESKIAPSEHESLRGKQWKKYIDSGKSSSRCAGGCNLGTGVDLSCDFFGASTKGVNVAAYAFTYIYSDSNRTLEINMGGSDGYIAWLNGDPIWNFGHARHCGCFSVFDSKKTVRLNEGLNRLLVKVGSKSSRWGFVLSFNDATGLSASTSGNPTATGASLMPPFLLDQSGQLFVNNPAALNYENQRAYILTVRVTDAGGYYSDMNVKIDVLDANEGPRYPPFFEFTVIENSLGGTKVGTPVAASDVDENEKFSYQMLGGGKSFYVDTGTGQIMVQEGAILDYEGPVKLFELTIICTDAGFPPKEASVVVRIHVLDANEPPVLNEATYNVYEGLPRGATIGESLHAFSDDPDHASVFDYSSSFVSVQLQAGGVSTTGSAAASIQVAGEEFVMDNPGHHIVTMNLTDGHVIDSVNFDTVHDAAGDAALSKYLENIPHGHAVLVATQGQGNLRIDNAEKIFRSMGASIISPELDGSYAFLGKAGIFGVNELSWQRLKVTNMFKRDVDGYAVAMEGCLKASGNAVIVGECNAGDASQIWNYRGDLLKSGLDGRCLDVTDLAIGTTLTLVPCNNTVSPYWSLDGGVLKNQMVGFSDSTPPSCVNIQSSLVREFFEGFGDPTLWAETNGVKTELIGNGNFLGHETYIAGAIEKEFGSFDGDTACVDGAITCGSRVITSVNDGPDGKRAWVLEFREPNGKHSIPGRKAEYSIHNAHPIGYAGVF